LQNQQQQLALAQAQINRLSEQVEVLAGWRAGVELAVKQGQIPAKSLRHWDQRRRYLEATDGGRNVSAKD
jgi:hypothetical protein